MIPVARRVKYHRNPLRVPGQPWQPPYVPDTLVHSHDEGVVTESIDGRHVRVTVRLARTWTVMLGLAGGDQCDTPEFRRLFEDVRRIARWFDCALKLAVCSAMLWIAFEVGTAFLPGGAVDRVIGGWK